MSRPSQKLIAKKLGISTAAVSLALRDKGTVSKELTEKVKAMAESLGYRPNPVLASLASKRFRESSADQGTPICLIDFHGDASHGRRMFNVLKERATELGYHPTIIDASELSHYLSPDRTLYNRGVQGLVIHGPVPSSYFSKGFDWSLFSVVVCGRYLSPLPFDTVRPDIFQSIKQAYCKAREYGYRRIGFALGRHVPIIEDDESRLSAVLGLQRLMESGKAIPPYFEQISDFERITAWARKYQPDCVLGFHTGQAWYLLEHGFRIPEDMGFASIHLHHKDTLGTVNRWKVAGNVQNLDEVGRQSINLLDQKIKHHEQGIPRFAKHVLVQSTWLDGSTLRRQGTSSEAALKQADAREGGHSALARA